MCTTPTTPIKICTFNLFNYAQPPYAYYDFESIYSDVQWAKKQAWICAYLARFKPDVIAFQEVFSIDSLQKLLKEAGYAYFSVVDAPTLSDGFIYRDPVLAIASRYPIKETYALGVDPTLLAPLGLSADFSFSRKVLRASIELPHIGLCDFYVVHLKSKRSLFEYYPDAKERIEKTILGRLKAQLSGGWGSTVQRGSEALLLHMAILERREKLGLPVVLLGDFNNNLEDGVLSQLLKHELRFVTGAQDKQYLDKYCLKNAWDLYQKADPERESQPCPGTHYFAQQWVTLDHILLSSEFDTSASQCFFSVSAHHTHVQHLVCPIFEYDQQSSDHGVVMITLAPRR